jgi:hypothetical protein
LKKLTLLVAMLAMVLVAASPALAQATATTNANQALKQGDVNVSATSAAAPQTLFIAGGEQTSLQENVGGGNALSVQSQVLTGIQAQVPISVAANAQQVPVTAAADADLDLQLLLDLGGLGLF